MAKNFDYQGAVDAGYTDDEITSFLTEQHPTFDYQGAISEGYSPSEVNQFLSTYKPERTNTQKAGRIAGQFALGLAENAALPYEIASIPTNTESYYTNENLQNAASDYEDLLTQKQFGEWTNNDEVFLKDVEQTLLNPEKASKGVKPIDISIRGLTEKATGLDLHPEGMAEKAAGWLGFIKDPKKIIQKGNDLIQYLKDPKGLAKLGLKPAEIIKSWLPGTDEIRGITAGTAMQMAEDEQFGPAGRITAMVIGDLAGGIPKLGVSIAKNPKAYAANALNKLTMNNMQRQVTKQLIEDFNEAGIKIDAGTLTNSDIVKSIQARLTQSGLTGDALDNLRKEMSQNVATEYAKLANEVGEFRFENDFQAAEAIKQAVHVNEISIGKPADINREGRSLQGRVSVEPRPDYEQNLLNRIAPQEFENSIQAGETLKTAAEDIKAPIKDEINRQWTEFKDMIEQLPPVGPQAQLAEDLQQFIRSNRGSLLLGESAAEARVLRSAEELVNRLITDDGALHEIALSDLIKTKRTLADIANWEFGGSNFQSSYKKLVADVDRAIDRSLSSFSPELQQSFEHLNAQYSAFKDVFENKNVLPLFEPKNQNYNAIYNGYVTNPDKLRSLEDLMYISPRGQVLVDQVKRDYAQRELAKGNLSDRDIRNLGQVLGPELAEDLEQFVAARRDAIANPTPRPRNQRPLGIDARLPQTQATKALPALKEKGTHLQKKMGEFLKGKNEKQIMAQMNSVSGIRKLRRALETTPEGKELFKELSRYKLDEMIYKKMNTQLTQQTKLGTFGGLLKTTEDKAIVKELVGTEAFKRLQLLQKNSAKLSESAGKFFNASQSGTTAIDVSALSLGLTGILTGNPWMTAKVFASLGGARVLTNLLGDAVFLKELEKAILTNSPSNFANILKKMEPSARKAMIDEPKY